MRLLSFITASVLSSLAIASPLANSISKESSDIVPRATTCDSASLEIFNNDITYGTPFCQFWQAIDRTRSPIPGLSVQQIDNICDCIIDGRSQPAARVGDDPSPRTVTQTVTRALTTARSVPIRTTGVSTVIRSSTITIAKSTITVAKTTVTARPTNVAKSTVTIARTTITQKVAKSTITLRPTSTVTIAKTTVTAKASSANVIGGNASGAAKSTVTIAKSTITVARSTVTRVSTSTVARTTITAQNANAQTTMFKTVTLSPVGSGQKTVTTISKVTVTAKASNAAQSTIVSVKTVTSAQSAAVRTVTSVKTIGAQSMATKTVTSVQTAGPQSTVTRVVTSVSTVTNVQTQAASQSANTVASSASGSSSDSASASATVSSSASTSDSSSASNSAASSATSTSDSSSAAASTTSSSTKATCTLAPSTTPPSSVNVADTEYERFYRGCGYTENEDNPGNAYFSDNFPPVVTTFNSSVSATDAVQTCAMDAFYRYDDPNQYLSFDLHFISTSGQGAAGEGGEGYWECVQYFSEQSDTDASPYFNVPNPNVTIAYGYSSGLYSDAAAVAAQQNSKRAVLESSSISESSHIHPDGRGQRLSGNFTLSPISR